MFSDWNTKTAFSQHRAPYRWHCQASCRENVSKRAERGNKCVLRSSEEPSHSSDSLVTTDVVYHAHFTWCKPQRMKESKDTWCVTCTLVCLFFVRPGTWVALEHLQLASIVIRFSNSSVHITVRKCRNSSKNDNKSFWRIGYMHIRSGAPKSSLLGCKIPLANSLKSSL